MNDLYSRLARMALPIVSAACALLLAACARTGETTSTTTVATAAAPPPAQATPTPASSVDPELGTGPGVAGDASQTAALSAPANSNGTTPPTGIVPKPDR
jgi:hypothetical protein